MTNQIKQRLSELTNILLDDANSIYTLRPETLETRDILETQSETFRRHQEIETDETRTAQGLAISPTMAAMCTDDFVRTITYLRGLNAAIRDLRRDNAKNPLRVLYAGTGPYAVLAIPLMTVWSSDEVVFEILDIHDTSIEAVKTIVQNLDLGSHVSAYHCIDAMEYTPHPDNFPDIIIAEVMLAGLENEPQVAVTRSLTKKMPDALFLPESIEVSAYTEDPDHDLGTVFKFDKSMFGMAANDANMLPASTLKIPEKPSSTQEHQRPSTHIFLQTRVQVYGTHTLEKNDSGLTVPQLFNCDFEYGKPLKIAYQMGENPKLVRVA
ncbi:MAG: hypothetical protein ABJO36_08665 [Litorimonas sp.]